MSEISYKVLVGVSWAFTGLAMVLTASRFWIRSKVTKSLAWDDAAHLLGLLLLIAQVSIVSGAASMIYRIVIDETEESPRYGAEQLLFVRLDLAGILITWCCLYAIKTSFMLLYHHIFRISERFIRAWWVVLGIVFLTFWILIAGSLTQCGSPSALEHVENCLAPSMLRRQKVFVIYGCVLNVFSDLAIMALPLAMLKGLQMRTPVKLGLAGVFCFAIITIAFDILRAVETNTKGGIEGSTALWTNLESAIAVIVSCLPSLVALFNPKKEQNGGRHGGPYRQRSLAISESAKLYINNRSSSKSGYSERFSAETHSDYGIVNSTSSVHESSTGLAHSEGSLTV